MVTGNAWAFRAKGAADKGGKRRGIRDLPGRTAKGVKQFFSGMTSNFVELLDKSTRIFKIAEAIETLFLRNRSR